MTPLAPKQSLGKIQHVLSPSTTKKGYLLAALLIVCLESLLQLAHHGIHCGQGVSAKLVAALG